MDISHWIANRAQWSPDKAALRFEGEEITYAQLEQRVARLAGGLADGLRIRPGDRVAYLGWNSPALLELLFACVRLGAIFVPLNARMTVEQHSVFLAHCQPRCMVVDATFRQHAARCQEQRESIPIVVIGLPTEEVAALRWEAVADSSPLIRMNADLSPSTPLLLAYTSGTTGLPKGALLTQEALF
jgi:fatty-acyl-CoA synthase